MVNHVESKIKTVRTSPMTPRKSQNNYSAQLYVPYADVSLDPYTATSTVASFHTHHISLSL